MPNRQRPTQQYFENAGFSAFLAPAKINLFLHITGRRNDGYHTLQTVFQLLDFYDSIYLKIRTDGAIHKALHTESFPETNDLCVRAAIALQQYTNCTLGADIAYTKHIPIGAGLGGGSSDAATVLLALNHLWQLNLNRHTLMNIGLKLGADVPLFIFGQNAWAESVGEDLQAVSLMPLYYVVVTPQVHVSTAQVFTDFASNKSLTKYTNPKTIAGFSGSPHSDFLGNEFKNDLENLVCQEFSAVAQLLSWLKKFGAARMSGSGGSVFLAVSEQQEAEYILQQKPDNTSGFIAKSLNQHPLFNFC